MNTNETFDHNDEWAHKFNAQRMREATEEAKQRDEAIARRRAEWTALPDAEKICIVCKLKLDPVTIARITEAPGSPRRHSFCDSMSIGPGVIPGLVGLLREAFGKDEEIPLKSLSQVVETWRSQSGLCAVSRIKLAFKVEETPEKTPTSREYSSLISAMDQAAMRLRDDEERKKLVRHSELHSPVIIFDGEGKLTLVSATVARWKSGMSDDEFRSLVRILNTELIPAYPVSASYNPTLTQGNLSQRSFR
jgi:hypothetical protein